MTIIEVIKIILGLIIILFFIGICNPTDSNKEDVKFVMLLDEIRKSGKK